MYTGFIMNCIPIDIYIYMNVANKIEVIRSINGVLCVTDIKDLKIKSLKRFKN